MLRSHHHFFRILFQLSDATIILLSWILAFVVRTSEWLVTESDSPVYLDLDFPKYAYTGIALVFLWFISLQVSGAYKSWRTLSLFKEVFSILKATAICFLIFTALVHFLARDEYSRIIIASSYLFSFVGLTGSRIILRNLLKYFRRRGWNLRHILMVGDFDQIDSLVGRLNSRSELGLKIVGYLSSSERKLNGVARLGNLEVLDSILKEVNLDQVIVCLSNKNMGMLDKILKVCFIHNIYVRVIPDVSQYSILGVEVEDFDGIPLLSINQGPMVGWNSVLKRISDFVYALVALIVFSPLMFLISILIKLSSKGPVFYSQERMGLDGQIFKMYKFRSMKTNAEKGTGAVWATENDSRVTMIGRFLRQTSLDELPQLFNVLKGDMSCVGPRPERPFFVDEFRRQIPWYMLRHKVKAGMTGWAQVNGFRGNTSLEGRVKYDLYYINNWSLFFDFRILIMTVFKGFISPNAY